MSTLSKFHVQLPLRTCLIRIRPILYSIYILIKSCASVRLLEHELQSHKISHDWKPFKQLWNVNGDSLEKAYSGIRIKKKKDKGKDKKESTANNMQRVYVSLKIASNALLDIY